MDWKTDRPRPGSDREAMYKEQVRLYAEALIRTRVGRDPERIRTELVGPVATDPGLGEAGLDALDPVLAEPLEAALAEGIAAPEVGAEVEGFIVELLWPDRLALLVDPPPEAKAALEALGLEVWCGPAATLAPEGFWDRVRAL